MGIPLRVLMVEDSEDDAFLVARELMRSGYEPTLKRVETAAEMKAMLVERTWDVIIADYSLPRFSGMAALTLARKSGPDLPFIIVSGTIGEEIAVAAMRAGAHDYVLKDNLARLGPAVQRELQEAKVRQARRQAEQSLQESESRFRRMADSIQDGLTIIEGGDVVYVNDRACEIFGYPRGEYVHMSIEDFAAPEERSRLQQVMADIRQQGKSLQELELWIIRKDGTRRYIRNRFSASSRGSKGANHYVVTTDITERKLAEQEVEERRRYLEGVLASAPDAIVTLDADHNIVEWNSGAERLFGFSHDEALGRNIDQLINNPSTMEQALGFTRIVMDGRRVPPVEAIRYRKDGTPVDVILAGSPILVGNKSIGAVAVYTDISERKRAERLLQALNKATLAVEQALTPEEIFTTIGEEFRRLGLHCAVFLTNADQTLLFPTYFSYDDKAVRAAERLLGIKAADFTIAIGDVEAFSKAVWEGKTVFVEGAGALQQVLPRPLRNLSDSLADTLGLLKSISAPLTVGDQVIGMLSVQSADLSEEDKPAMTAFARMMSAAWRKAQLLQDLERSLAELKQTQSQLFQSQKLEALGRLAGGIAHDFNNLLTVIDITTRMVERQLHPQDPLWEHVLRIRETGVRAAKLTKHLLSFSRREIVEPRIVNLNELVGDLSRMLQRVIGEDVRLVTTLHEHLWLVKVDPAQMEQVIVNLVVNARDAMPEGGLLTIETANVTLDDAYAARHVEARPGQYVLFTLSDTGVGMDDEVKAHLFEPFFTTKQRGEGTGLGLSTVFGIVKQSGGHIQVDSKVGQGTTFLIYLPRSDEARVSDETSTLDASEGAAQGTETILVAEDETDVRELAVYILSGLGYQILAAENGLEALTASDEHSGSIHLLLTDVVMPQMNGRELAEQLCARRPGLKVLYMSGYSDDVIAYHGVLEKGANVLNKPFTLEELAQKVRTVLDA